MTEKLLHLGVQALGCAYLTVLGCLPGAVAEVRAREARVAVPVASVFASPTDQAERVTQGLLWERVLVLGHKGPWSRVLLPDQYRTPEGYPGWMLSRHLVLDTPARLDQVLMVGVARAVVRLQPRPDAPVLSVAWLSSRLPWDRSEGEWFRVALPDRKEPGWVHESEVLIRCLPPNGRDLLETAWRLEHTPYLWGGMTPLGIDCSGLVHTVFKVHGRLLPRDADQQFQVGVPVEEADLRPGDLVFFGSDPDHVNHVGLYLEEGFFLDASGRKGVDQSRLDDPKARETFLGGRRIFGAEEKELPGGAGTGGGVDR
ncbi:MAG: NlpC/P60 family protein [Candidatus Xenobium sp.]|nr:C40 family peptidase [Burkholderiales bacterium]